MLEFVAWVFVSLLLIISKFLSSLYGKMWLLMYTLGQQGFLGSLVLLIGSFSENKERENAPRIELWWGMCIIIFLIILHY